MWSSLIHCFVVVILCFIALLPWQFSTIHLRLISFTLLWLCCAKLLLFCFDSGPLVRPSLDHSLFMFILIVIMPIKVKSSTSSKASPLQVLLDLAKTLLNISFKAMLLNITIKLYAWRVSFWQELCFPLFGLFVILTLDVFLTSLGAVVHFGVGIEIAPHFDKPLMATSLQDFWTRWNIVVADMLKQVVYKPIRTSLPTWLPVRLSRYTAIAGTFTASGLIHELAFYLILEVPPTWEATCFFLLQGFLVVVEDAIKLAFGGLVHVGHIVSNMATLLVLFATASWLFILPLRRAGSDLKLMSEYDLLGEWLSSIQKGSKLMK